MLSDGLGYSVQHFDDILFLKVDSSGIITTIAGLGNIRYSGDGGPASASQLTFAKGVAISPSGDIYIADTGNFVVRKVKYFNFQLRKK